MKNNIESARIPNGVWPTMITPFDEHLQIDYAGHEAMIEWYMAAGVHGLFAVCQSSEMFLLSLDERLELAARSVDAVDGRVPVVASGHVSDRLEDQIHELSRMAETGVDAVVLVVNRLSTHDGSVEGWMSNLHRLLDALPPQIPLGFYECPYPDDVKLTDEMTTAVRDSGRFVFIKDTTCSVAAIRRKLEILRGSSVRLYNANTATLYETFQLGANGYCGVMANFHPNLYVRLWNLHTEGSESARLLASYLAVAHGAVSRQYPLTAKYYMRLVGLPVSTTCRIQRDLSELEEQVRLDVEHFHRFNRHTVEHLRSSG